MKLKTAEVREIRNTLRGLLNVQNGCPLPKYQASYDRYGLVAGRLISKLGRQLIDECSEPEDMVDCGIQIEDIAAALATLTNGRMVESIDALRDALRAYGLKPPAGDLTHTQAILEKRLDALSYRVCLLEGPVETINC